MTVELILGDCIEIMDGMESKTITAGITDPPYGEGIHNMGFTNNVHGGVTLRNDYSDMQDWDVKVDNRWIDEMFRITHKQLIFGGNFFELPTSRCWLVWDKKSGGVYSNDFADVELAWTSLDKPSRIIRHLWHGMIQQDMKNKEKRYHPTQKPIPVMVRAIEMLTDVGDTVLDPFMGSGTTGVACVQTGRNFVGYEINPTYFEIAEKRIREAQLQPRLI